MSEDKKENPDWKNQADNELNSSEWFGAIIRCFWNLGQCKLDTFYNYNELVKNAIDGNVIKGVLLILFYCAPYFIG